MKFLFRDAVYAALLLVVARGAGAAEGVKTALPYLFNDDQGNVWQVRQDGSTGRPDLFPEDGYGKLYTSHGDFPDVPDALFDAAHSQLTLGPAAIHGVNVTRILTFDKKRAICRYVDLFENTTGKEVRFDWVQPYFKVAGGMKFEKRVFENAQTRDPAVMVIGSDQVFTGVVAAGRQSAFTPQVLYAANKQGIGLKYGAVVVPANGAAALVHAQVRRANAEEAAAFLTKTAETEYLGNLPAKAAGHVVNFGTAAVVIGSPAGIIKRIGKYELPRGDALDLLDLRGGDHCKGTVAETAYHIQTAYGAFDLPAESVAGMVALTTSGTRQLLVTINGQALAGRIDKPSITVRVVTKGSQVGEQIVQVPLAEVVRLGYRPRPDEQEPAADRPTVLLRAGDVLAIEPLEAPVRMVTRYGVLQIEPALIANIVFDSEDTGLHTVHLIDGSSFGALIESDQLAFKLKFTAAGASAAAEVRFPPGTIARVNFSTKIHTVAGAATLKLSNDDLVIGTLQGPLKLDTALDTMSLDPARLKRLARIGDGAEAHIQATFNDDTQFSGQLDAAAVEWRLHNGASLKVPVDQLREITLPQATTQPATSNPSTAPASH